MYHIKQCLEIYLLNPVLTYKDAFKRIRNIAFHVKQSKKLKQLKLETIQSIYNWRFINIIRLWNKILLTHSNKNNSDLYLLYYPFIQICCSAMYNPGRIKIIQSLIQLIQKCQKSSTNTRQIYVPLAPYLISIINNPAFYSN